VEQEQRGQALLAVQGMQGRAVDLSVHEVEPEGLAAGDGVQQCLEEDRADLLDGGTGTPLRVVALDEWDLDPVDAWGTGRARLEEPGVRRQVALHVAASSLRR
jgi:hypothetical protein